MGITQLGQESNSLCLELFYFQIFAPVLQLQAALLLGFSVQRISQILKLRLKQYLDVRHLPGSHLLRRMKFMGQLRVFCFQIFNSVNVHGQTVVQILQLVFLLNTTEPCRTQRSSPPALFAVGRTSRGLVRLRRTPGRIAFS